MKKIAMTLLSFAGVIGFLASANVYATQVYQGEIVNPTPYSYVVTPKAVTGFPVTINAATTYKYHFAVTAGQYYDVGYAGNNVVYTCIFEDKTGPHGTQHIKVVSVANCSGVKIENQGTNHPVIMVNS